ncbi:MAG: hypothetical protein ACFFAS_09610 [Promethearchaeota archaeon]
MVELTFQLARKAENVHRKLFSKFIKQLDKNKISNKNELFVCIICGNVELERPTENCTCAITRRNFSNLSGFLKGAFMIHNLNRYIIPNITKLKSLSRLNKK